MPTRRTHLCFSLMALLCSPLTQADMLFQCGFEGKGDTLTPVYGAIPANGEGRDGSTALRIDTGEASIRSQTRIAEAGALDLWVRTSTPHARYTLNVLMGESQNRDGDWIPVAQFSGSNDSTDYRARRLSIDDTGEKFLRIDIEASDGTVFIDDVSVSHILLDKALKRNQEKILGDVLDRIKDDRNYRVQADDLRALGKTYVDQIETQRQYLDFSNALFASVTLVQATAERSRMANPLAYKSFEGTVRQVQRVTTPLQKARVNSLLRTLGDLGTGTLNAMTQGLFGAFAEPFKTIVATAFDRASYSNADLDRRTRNFAEEHGLDIFNSTDRFLDQIGRELDNSARLDQDLAGIRQKLDVFRRDLEAHLMESMIAGGLGKGQENYNRITSKDDTIRKAALDDIGAFFQRQADSYKNRTSSDTQFVQFMMKASGNIEETRRFKERFNDIASAMITFYDNFERSVAADQNPFTDEADRQQWESRAASVRANLATSKEAFRKAYL